VSGNKLVSYIYEVLSILWCVISLVSVYKLVKGIVENKYDIIYITINCINFLILLIYLISKKCFISKKSLKKDTVIEKT